MGASGIGSGLPSTARARRPDTPVPSTFPSSQSDASAPKKIFIVKGDITTFKADAIVNAANTDLRAGGGVCGAIFNAAGTDAKKLKRKCAEFDGCPVGQARITSTSRKFGNLKAKHIVHAVGPDCRDPVQNRDKNNLLKSAYKRALREADKVGCRSIALPALSTGVFGFDLAKGAKIAVKTVEEYLPKCKNLQNATFVCFDDNAKNVFNKALQDNQRSGRVTSHPVAPSRALPQPHIPSGLSRFHDALSKKSVDKIEAELGKGKKETDWMWYAFPQEAGLGGSERAQIYAIRDMNEAKAFLNDSGLRSNLIRFTTLAKKAIEQRIFSGDQTSHEVVEHVFNSDIDAAKFKSCMDLFAKASNEAGYRDTIFHEVLANFYGQTETGVSDEAQKPPARPTSDVSRFLGNILDGTPHKKLSSMDTARFFPQLAATSESTTYAINSLEEAQNFLKDKDLRAGLEASVRTAVHSIVDAQLDTGCDVNEGIKYIFDDAGKGLQASLTLFAQASTSNGDDKNPFQNVLGMLYGGQKHIVTEFALQRLS